MTKLILSTSNIITGGPSIILRPTPEKSNVELISALRTNIVASREAAADVIAATNGTNGSNGSRGWNGAHGPEHIHRSSHRPPWRCWTSQEGSVLYVPAVDWLCSGLAEERSQYDITVKLFYLPGMCPRRRKTYTEEAIGLVLRELKVPSIDLLILSFPGVSFDVDVGDEVDSAGRSGCSDSSGSGDEARAPSARAEVEDVGTMVKTWRTVEELQARGVVGQLGVAEFGDRRLAEFLKFVDVRPSVDQINVRDCCTVPASLIAFAKHERIQLLTHHDSADILPAGTLRELLEDGEGEGEGAGGRVRDRDPVAEVVLGGDIQPQWVVKYTAVVKDRGVVENKGYFAAADLKARDG
ncbi:MAG: hypothetical protein M1826_006638 [Phylliscum demangeonii]|nr:MAG: hypothetical protein M1826_006638 [Phylliscum demangeonii]